MKLPTPHCSLVFCAALLLCHCGGDDAPSATFIEPAYGDPCDSYSCLGQGVCVSPEGAPRCICDDGYAGEHCDACAAGFHRDANDHCVPDTLCADQTIDPCGNHGQCKDDEGTIACACDQGYQGPRCTLCASGYALDSFGDCLQKVLANGQLVTLPARCSNDTCHDHGDCSDRDGLVACDCYPGYNGARCDACASGYTKPSGSDRCVDTEKQCDVTDCGVCERFDGDRAVPTAPDTCVSQTELQRAGMLLRSVGGEGMVWLCAASSRYGFTSDHVALETGAKIPAEIRLGTPIVGISFDYAAWDPLTFDVLADQKPVETITVARYAKKSLALWFDEPITMLEFRSTDGFGHTLALDSIVYEPARCE